MKTAMQELMELLKIEENSISDNDSHEDRCWRNGVRCSIKKAIELLEKEKEQIIDFHVMLMKHGLEQEGNVTKWDYNLLKDEAEEYYNQTYN